MGAVGLAIMAAAAITPFKVRQEGYRLQVKGPLHRFCGVAVKGRVLKPQKRGLFSSCYDLAPEITDLDAPVTIKVGLPLSPLDWSMVIHPFEPGF